MTGNSEQAKINPRIIEVEIGLRELRTIKLYPLSVASQTKFKELFNGIVSAAKALDERSLKDISVWAAFVFEQFQVYAGKMLSIVTGEDGEKLLEDIDNVQLYQISEIVFKTNYDVLVKNLKPSLEKGWKWLDSRAKAEKEKMDKIESLLKKSQPPFSGTTEDTPLTTFTGITSKTAD